MAFNKYKVNNTDRKTIETAESNLWNSMWRNSPSSNSFKHACLVSIRTRSCAWVPACVFGFVIKKLTTSPPRRQHDDSPPTNSYWSAALLLCPSRLWKVSLEPISVRRDSTETTRRCFILFEDFRIRAEYKTQFISPFNDTSILQ